MASIDYSNKLVANRYAVSHELGQGGMGIVYAADDLRLSRRVAIKFMTGLSEQSIVRFQREYKMLAKVSCPNIVQIFERGQCDDGTPFIVMECINGRTLEQALSDSSDRPNIEEVITIALQICTALCHLHKLGLVHRDLTPSNIMLTKDDGMVEAKLMDFGAVHETDIALTGTNELLGSPAYMSPEHLTPKLLDGRSDIFSMGCVLYRCVSEKPPFEADTALQTLVKMQTGAKEALNARVPLFLRKIIDRCTMPNPADRFQSAEELHKALNERECAEASTPSPPTRSVRPVLMALISVAIISTGFSIFMRTAPDGNELSRTAAELDILASQNSWRKFDELASKMITPTNQSSFPETWESFARAAHHFQVEGDYKKSLRYNALAVMNCSKINRKVLLEMDALEKRLLKSPPDPESDQKDYQWLSDNENKIQNEILPMARLTSLKARLSQRLNLLPTEVTRNFANAFEYQVKLYDQRHVNGAAVFDVGLDYARFLVSQKNPARKKFIERLRDIALDRLKNNSYEQWFLILGVLNLEFEEASESEASKLLAEFEPYPPKNEKDQILFWCQMYRLSLRADKPRCDFVDKAYRKISIVDAAQQCDVLLLMAQAHPDRKMELVQQACDIASAQKVQPHCCASIHTNLAQAYADRKEYQAAVKYIDQAIQEYIAGRAEVESEMSSTGWDHHLANLQKLRQLWKEKAKAVR